MSTYPSSRYFVPALLCMLLIACGPADKGQSRSGEPAATHAAMIQLLAEARSSFHDVNNSFAAEVQLHMFDSLLRVNTDPSQQFSLMYYKALTYIQLGQEQPAIDILEQLVGPAQSNPEMSKALRSKLAMAYLRMGERQNCLANHSAETCIFPLKGGGIHIDQSPARKAIELFAGLLKEDPSDLNAHWLLNIAYMAVGEYPGSVPKQYLIRGLDRPSEMAVVPFVDIAPQLRINVENMSGGAIVDDFDNDGLLDIVTSSWHIDKHMSYFHNNGDGSFADWSKESGLTDITGGLHIVQTDYNNDGLLDIYVLRGAWLGAVGKAYGEQPNSLLRNNGDGSFTDVTTEAGLVCKYPGQAAVWRDFNNDGWLDMFIGYESVDEARIYPCQLYINNKNGTFTDVGEQAGLAISTFVKGVTAGDFDNDGLTDIYVSSLTSKNFLYRNKGLQGGVPVFEDVTDRSGMGGEVYATFGTWFWDYDNDGWLDILVNNYEFNTPLSLVAAKEALEGSQGMAGKTLLYHNNGDGTFANVTRQAGLDKLAFAMGCNFGDYNNDGWLDFYLGTGNPNYESLIPNKFFHNAGGKRFVDITAAARVGNLQKGHSVSFADIDNNGVQDIFIQMGGAYEGDSFFNSLYYNEGQNNNSWISLCLKGVKSNKVAVGARITIWITENGVRRRIFREVNSGASFGASTLRREIGLGQAVVIDELIVEWPVSGEIQRWTNVAPRRFLEITEGNERLRELPVRQISFAKAFEGIPMCSGN